MIYGWYFNNYQNVHKDYPPHSLIISDSLITLNSLYGIILSAIFYSRTKDATKEYINIFNNIKDSLASLCDKNHGAINEDVETPYFKM